MTAAPSSPEFPSDIGYAGLRKTADEYLTLGETPERVDPADGSVRVWRRQGPRLLKAAIERAVLNSAAIPGVVLDLAPIVEIARADS